MKVNTGGGRHLAAALSEIAGAAAQAHGAQRSMLQSGVWTTMT